MASNPPPFQVEDNTDEDFFDKLVNDDDDDMGLVTMPIASTSVNSSDGKESDAARAFSNLNISDSGNGDEFNFINDDDFGGNVDAGVEPGDGLKPLSSENSLPTIKSFSFEPDISGLSEQNEGAEVLPDGSMISDSAAGVSSDLINAVESSTVSGASGVKEVDWSAFSADTAQNSSNGFGSYSDFFTEFGVDETADEFDKIIADAPKVELNAAIVNAQSSLHASSSNGSVQYNDVYTNGMISHQSSVVQNLNSTQYWEEQYPGYKYDATSGQWFQVDGYNASSELQANATLNSSTWGVTGGNSESLYVQENSQIVTGAVTEAALTASAYSWNESGHVVDSIGTSSNWNAVPEVGGVTNGADTGYPPNMLFDPQYPGWYYDTNLQQWLELNSYNASAPSLDSFQNHMTEGPNSSTNEFFQNVNATAVPYSSTNAFSQNANLAHTTEGSYSSTDAFSQNVTATPYGTGSEIIRSGSESFESQVARGSWEGSTSSYQQPNTGMWLPEPNSSVQAVSPDTTGQQFENTYGQNVSENVAGSYQSSFSPALPNKLANQSHTRRFSMPSQNVADVNLSQYFSDAKANINEASHFLGDHQNINQASVNFAQPFLKNVQAPYVPASGRSSIGRPLHALVAFGFGGKLVIMKPNSSNEKMNFVSQNHSGGQVSILSLAEIAKSSFDSSIHGKGETNPFGRLCHHPIPGPLTSAFGGMKELNKWIDESVSKLEPTNLNSRVLQLLLSLLRISCQHYGKLRSPYGADVMKENESPESAVAKLFASAKGNDPHFSQYASTPRCLKQQPSEGQIQATATEVQKLLVSGRKREALQCAQEGQLWGPAIVLAAQLGNQFYAETVKQMAFRQLASGSPLRTLCLLIAGCPADVFSADSLSDGTLSGAVDNHRETIQGSVNAMLDDWEENLAVITANRTKGDELVLLHLGDCLWKEKSDIIAAHICYLVAEAEFEPYSDSARLCLLGADHWKSPRTYASAEAIQRTEVFEYSKILGNSQFVLLPFQPYKFVYAMMLIEVGRISEALKYCQAVLKSLKTGRNPEVENLRNLVLSLEDRIKLHQQGGFSANPKEFIGKLLNLFDSTAQRVVGGMPSVPSATSVPHGNDYSYQAVGTRVSASQSTLAMSSLVPSQSMEPISDWASDGNQKTKHIRSVSEPDFGRSPMKSPNGSIAQSSSSNAADKASAVGTTSRFGRFYLGSQLLHKTVGLVLKPLQGRQAKLGDTNKFYYDPNLKRWIEEGAEPAAEESLLPPPPKTSIVQNGNSDPPALPTDGSSHFHASPELKTPNAFDNHSGMPPLPPMTNFPASRSRMGPRQRYVDPFNKGASDTTSSFRSPPGPSAKPAVGGNTSFFVPASVSTADEPSDAVSFNNQNASTSTSPPVDSLEPTPLPAPVQRIGSMNSISNKTSADGFMFAQSRRSASWSGSFNATSSNQAKTEVKGEFSSMDQHPLAFISSESSGGFGDELQEVEL